MPSPFYDPFHGAGRAVNYGPNKVVWYVELGDGKVATCVQELVSPIFEDNQRELNDSAGKRWGDGKIAARIPLGFYFDKLAPAKRAGDERYIKKILNDSDYRKFRTFGGDM
jgi:hypothetical protein